MPQLPDPKLFWAKVRKTKTCWLWTASKTWAGYGRIATNGKAGRKTRQAHRVSWEMHFGAIGNKQVLHKCDVRHCVRPSHLFRGNPQDNIDDMFQKNRANKVKGRKHWNAKMTDRKIRAIRRLAKKGMPLKEIAVKYNLTISMVSLIVNRKRWKHIS